MVSRTGGNMFYGSAYEYLRNSLFNAKAFKTAGVLPFRPNLKSLCIGLRASSPKRLAGRWDNLREHAPGRSAGRLNSE